MESITEQQSVLMKFFCKKITITVSCVLIALPIISIIMNAVSILRFGIDIPFWDDWRQYLEGNMGRIDLKYLLTPANDTLYSIGKLFDSLVFRFLDGNTIAYQFTSLACVLGGLLALQWRLLGICTDNLLIKACAFSLTVLMLQPNSYWGLQNLAYHQAIPLVCVLAALAITFSKTWHKKIAVLILFMLSLISGFSYISGAFAMLGLSLFLLVAQHFMVGSMKERLVMSGVSMLGPASVSALAQAWVIVGVQHGVHVANTPLAYPWEINFWAYLLGMIARSLMLPVNYPGLSIGIVVIVVGITLGALGFSVKRLIAGGLSEKHKRLVVIFGSLVVVVGLYLMLVAAGRTNLGGSLNQSILTAFIHGNERFHYYWVTLLWPWVAMIFLVWFCQPSESGWAPVGIGVVFIATILLGIKCTMLFQHSAYYKMSMERRLAGIDCLREMNLGVKSIYCSQLYPGDLSTAYSNALRRNASFTRGIVTAIPIGSDLQPPLYRVSEHENDIRLVNLEREPFDGKKLLLRARTNDPMLVFKTGQTDEMQSCRFLDVKVRMEATKTPYSAQLFFVPTGAAGFSKENSIYLHVRARGQSLLSFSARSDSGFQDVLRFDPVASPQTFSIDQLEVRCRYSLKKTGGK